MNLVKTVAHRGSDEIRRIGQQAVREAQDNLRRKGIPLFFSRNGRIYYEMPDGSIQTENPYPAMLRARATELRARGIVLLDEHERLTGVVDQA